MKFPEVVEYLPRESPPITVCFSCSVFLRQPVQAVDIVRIIEDQMGVVCDFAGDVDAVEDLRSPSYSFRLSEDYITLFSRGNKSFAKVGVTNIAWVGSTTNEGR
jgi:hypothetical protein